MISLQDSQIQTTIDRYVESRAGLHVSSYEILQFVDFDPSEAERHLSIWMERHPNDYVVIGKNPMILKVYGTVVYKRRR